MRSLPAAGRKACVLFAALLALPALAQTPTRDRPFPELDDASRWGPFLIDLAWAIDNIGYDGNVFLVPEGVPKETDWFIRTGPDLRGQLRIGHRMALTFHDRYIWELYTSHSDLNQSSNDLDGQFDFLLGSVLLTTKGKTSSTFGRPSNELDERTRVDRRELGETVRLFIGSRTDLAGEYVVERLRYNDPDFLVSLDPGGTGDVIQLPIETALNRDRERFNAEWGWRPAGRTRVFARYSLRKDDFRSDSLGRDVEERRRTIGLEFSPSAFLSGRVEVGRSRLETTQPVFDYQPYDGAISDTQLVYRPTGSTRFTADLERDVRFSTYENNLYYRRTNRGLRMESYLGGSWGVQLGVSRIDLDYPEANTVTAPIGQRREDQINDVFAGVLLRLPGALSFSVRIGRRDRKSNVAFAEDKQTYFSTSSSFRF